MITLTVRDTTTVQQVKLMIQQREGIIPNNQTLLFQGKTITKRDGATMNTLRITKDAVLHLMKKMLGGEKCAFQQ